MAGQLDCDNCQQQLHSYASPVCPSVRHEKSIIRASVAAKPHQSVQQGDGRRRHNGPPAVQLPTYTEKEKVWWPLFLNVVNITIVAVWRVHTQLHSAHSINHLDFRREIALCLLKVSVASKPLLGHRVNMPDDVRFDGIGGR